MLYIKFAALKDKPTLEDYNILKSADNFSSVRFSPCL